MGYGAHVGNGAVRAVDVNGGAASAVVVERNRVRHDGGSGRSCDEESSEAEHSEGVFGFGEVSEVSVCCLSAALCWSSYSCRTALTVTRMCQKMQHVLT